MKRFSSILFALVMVLALAACGNTSSADQAAEPAPASLDPEQSASDAIDSLRDENGEIQLEYVGIVFPQMAAPYFVEAEKQIRETLEAEGIKVETGSSDNTHARQMEIIENFGQMGLDGIVIFPMAGSEIADTLEALQNDGVRVVVMATHVDSGYDALIMTNDADRGLTCAQMAADWIEKTFPDAAPGTIEVGLLTVRVDPATISIADGMATVAELTDKAVVVAEYDTTFADGAPKVQENAEMLVANNPDIKVIIAQVHSMSVDEVVLTAPGIDLENFAIFTDTIEAPIRDRILMSADNSSVIRGVAMVGPYGRIYHVAHAMLGRLELGPDNIYWNPVSGVTLENMDELLGDGWD